MHAQFAAFFLLRASIVSLSITPGAIKPLPGLYGNELTPQKKLYSVVRRLTLTEVTTVLSMHSNWHSQQRWLVVSGRGSWKCGPPATQLDQPQPAPDTPQWPPDSRLLCRQWQKSPGDLATTRAVNAHMATTWRFVALMSYFIKSHLRSSKTISWSVFFQSRSKS